MRRPDTHNLLDHRAGFTVPEVFDWNATTGDNYGVPEGDFYGPYKAVRAELDYTVGAP